MVKPKKSATPRKMCQATPSSSRSGFPYPTSNVLGISFKACSKSSRFEGCALFSGITYSRFKVWMVVPAASTTSMIMGICPTACVEQDKHGSCARTAASTRLSKPS